MGALRGIRGDELIERRLAGGRPVLGICVGMQVLFEHGVERGVDTDGLGEWPGAVTELDAPVLPHMGWNTVRAGRARSLFEGIEDERFYFVHSYGAQHWTLEPMRPFRARDDVVRLRPPFLAAVENGPLSATQFHPRRAAPPASDCSQLDLRASADGVSVDARIVSLLRVAARSRR
jgi:glutamine amidotransferase